MEVGVLGVVPGVLGNLQALEAIKLILNFSNRLDDETLLFDLKSYSLHRIKQKRNPTCPLCGDSPSIKSIEEKNYLSSPAKNTAVDVDVFQLTPKDFLNYKLVDIREKNEIFKNPLNFKPHARIPLSKIKKNEFRFDPDQKYLFFCGKGFRSHTLAEELQKEGIKAFSVLNGAAAVKKYLKR